MGICLEQQRPNMGQNSVLIIWKDSGGKTTDDSMVSTQVHFFGCC